MRSTPSPKIDVLLAAVGRHLQAATQMAHATNDLGRIQARTQLAQTLSALTDAYLAHMQHIEPNCAQEAATQQVRRSLKQACRA